MTRAYVGVDGEAEFSGRTATGRFVEVTLLVRSTPATASALDLAAASVVLELPDGRTVRPIGLVTAAAGVRAVATGDAHVRADAPSAGDRRYVPLVVAFDVPDDATRARARLAGFPPFAVELE